jgi:hypothetical protein
MLKDVAYGHMVAENALQAIIRFKQRETQGTRSKAHIFSDSTTLVTKMGNETV